jgi:hypothetical protein
MRNLLTITVLLFSSFALQSRTPPETISKAFKQKFPDLTNVKWCKESKTEWEASFVLYNVSASANFSTSGDWLETEIEIPVTKIPEVIVSAIQEADKDCKIVGAALIENSKSETIYEAVVKTGPKKKEVFYKSDGVIII